MERSREVNKMEISKVFPGKKKGDEITIGDETVILRKVERLPSGVADLTQPVGKVTIKPMCRVFFTTKKGKDEHIDCQIV